MLTPRVVLAVGGTAGHFYPAIAVREAWMALAPGSRVSLAGTRQGLEASLADRFGLRLEFFPGAPFVRESVRGKAKALTTALAGVHAARRWLRSEGVDLVIGFGGYASVGVLLAARSLGIATAIHEANVRPGLANRLLGRAADRVFVSWPQAADRFPASKTVLSGTPVRAAFTEVGASRSSDRRRRPARIVVTGGSFGSAFLNERAPGLIHAVAATGLSVRVLHQTGDRGAPEPVHATYRALRIPARVTRYVDSMSKAYAWADFAITGAGAVTLAELSTARLPALVVPLSECSSRHQDANAEAFERSDGARWVAEETWQPERLAEHVVESLASPRAESETARSTLDAGAAAAIAAECRTLLIDRRGVVEAPAAEPVAILPVPSEDLSRASGPPR